MNKRKILLLASTLLMVAVLAVGGTLAYFTDADVAKNVFTIGNVQIDLKENFVEESKLVPVTYDENGERKADNVVNKDVFVTNTGSEEAYVRVHIAIPSILDDGDPNFDASANILHFNAETESYQDGFWNWGKAPADNDGLTGSAMVNGKNWNYYNAAIGGIAYNVYVVTYESILTKDATTLGYAMSQVYMDKSVTNQDITNIKNGWTDEAGVEHEGIGEKWNILVAAEGTQADGFANAFEALNTAFGVPGTYTVEWAGGTYVDEDDPS